MPVQGQQRPILQSLDTSMDCRSHITSHARSMRYCCMHVLSCRYSGRTLVVLRSYLLLAIFNAFLAEQGGQSSADARCMVLPSSAKACQLLHGMEIPHHGCMVHGCPCKAAKPLITMHLHAELEYLVQRAEPLYYESYMLASFHGMPRL